MIPDPDYPDDREKDKEKLFKFNNEPTILHLLSVWSANKFNNMLNEHFDELKFLISSLENYEYFMDDLYSKFNLFNIKIWLLV